MLIFLLETGSVHVTSELTVPPSSASLLLLTLVLRLSCDFFFEIQLSFNFYTLQRWRITLFDFILLS